VIMPAAKNAPPAPPVAIGGVGGSGTRLVADLVRALGVHTGDDLNAASDTLWFTLLFKTRRVLQWTDAQFAASVDALRAGLCRGSPLGDALRARVLELAGEDRPSHPVEWLEPRARSLIASASSDPHGGRWGWKEPNTHVVINRIWTHLPELRYIHVVRHGLDMAFSRNQNQLRLWGAHVLGTDGPASPERSLAYWCRTHQRMQRLIADNAHRMYWLDYDALCRAPAEEAAKLCRFLECPLPPALPLLDKVRQPGVPRHAGVDLRSFPGEDLDYVRSLGYCIVGSHARTGERAAQAQT